MANFPSPFALPSIPGRRGEARGSNFKIFQKKFKFKFKKVQKKSSSSSFLRDGRLTFLRAGGSSSFLRDGRLTFLRFKFFEGRTTNIFEGRGDGRITRTVSFLLTSFFAAINSRRRRRRRLRLRRNTSRGN